MTASPLQECRPGAALGLSALLLCSPVTATAADPAPLATVSTARAPAPVPTPAGTIRLEAFRNFRHQTPEQWRAPALHPGAGLSGSRSTPTAIGVAVDLVSCADGNLAASAIEAGGWQHRIGGPCANASAPRQGSVTLRAPPASTPSAPAAAGRPAACDPATWVCRLAPE